MSGFPKIADGFHPTEDFLNRKSRQPCPLLRPAQRRRDRSEAGSDDRAVTVLHQDMQHEAKLGFFAFALAEKPRLRVGGGGMRLVQAPLAMKIPPISRRGH
jgi:hypothetical protein